ncbi:TIGR00725 family protein [Marinomonas foliarum]|jgi:uncharacterized protein (TIGR00725 family)|uniref:TIGR00725 family protein n=1 Tax=Marinomonas foliarum TaxID=491950 RepID=A0A369AGK8_9GAMM|nr:TIGR00725 family protein [Marinomonas foliarum]QRV25628.1 TIGR00725 family protein [Marinomonas foliarum]RCX08311.1 hypothetical protein DFP77_1026 [Marinomonas foliarum]
MLDQFKYDSVNNKIYYSGQCWQPKSRTWIRDEDIPNNAEYVEDHKAILLALEMGTVSLPIGVIGPKVNATDEQLFFAEEVGRAVAEMGLPLLTGGKTGVMEASSRGAFNANGLTIGILPDECWSAANAYITIPIVTGLGPARNAIIGRTCPVLIAIGGSYGTLTEMAFGMHFDRCVLALSDAPEVEGVVKFNTVNDALYAAVRAWFGLHL